MPINSFDDYPMSWKPERASLDKPYYLSLATRLENDIRSGSLAADVKLPPQRELADYLDLNLSTITRAYKLCELKGLIYAVTGRGTFVSPNPPDKETFMDSGSGCIELGMIKPFYQCNEVILAAAREVLSAPGAAALFEYSNPLGSDRQLAAAQKWLRQLGVRTRPRLLLPAAGAQNALSVILVSLFQSGGKIAVDPFTYTNFRELANLLHIQLIAVEGDASGMCPDALEDCCRLKGISGVYLMPSCSNPTGICIPQERRLALADTVTRNNLLLIEDDIYSFLAPPGTTPLQALAPDHTVHICSISKSLCAGLRVAYLVFPESCRNALTDGLLNVNLKAVSLNAEIISHLIESGEAERLVQKKTAMAGKRNMIYRKYFPAGEQTVETPFFHWLRLPASLTGEAAELEAARHGIHVLGSHRFAVRGGGGSCFLRISVVSPDTEAQLDHALKTLKQIVDCAGNAPRNFFV